MVVSAIYVDPPTEHPLEAVQPDARRHGTRWSHLWPADPEALGELHAFAHRLGLRRSWFQDKPRFPHYDLVAGKYRQAVRLGAISRPLREWIFERRLNPQRCPGCRARPALKLDLTPSQIAIRTVVTITHDEDCAHREPASATTEISAVHPIDALTAWQFYLGPSLKQTHQNDKIPSPPIRAKPE